MGAKTPKFHEKLFDPPNVAFAFDAVTKLRCLVRGTDGGDYLRLLIDYARGGPIPELRAQVIEMLAEEETVLDAKSLQNPYDDYAWSCLQKLFEHLFDDPLTRSAAIVRVLRTGGADGLRRVTALALDEWVDTACRARAIRALAGQSGHPFGRDLSADPAAWELKDLRLSEIEQWAAAGFPKAAGHDEATRDAALDNPTNDFERLVATFEARVTAVRGDERSPNPRNCLLRTSAAQMRVIDSRWRLPRVYREFLERFLLRPVSVEDQGREKRGFELFGASSLIRGHHRFASGDEGEFNPYWPKHILVIAQRGNQPLVLDLSKDAPSGDAPVLAPRVSPGREYEVVPVAPSFAVFLSQITDSIQLDRSPGRSRKIGSKRPEGRGKGGRGDRGGW